MFDGILKLVAEALPALLDDEEAVEFEVSEDTTGGAGIADAPIKSVNAAPVEFTGVSRYLSSLDLKSPPTTPNRFDTMITNTKLQLSALNEMSPEQQAEYTRGLALQSDAVDTQIDSEQFESGVRSDVTESMSELAEKRSQSFGSEIYTPAENGLTLSDVDVPVGEHELTNLGNGIYERDGKQYRRLLNGTYRLVE